MRDWKDLFVKVWREVGALQARVKGKVEWDDGLFRIGDAVMTSDGHYGFVKGFRLGVFKGTAVVWEDWYTERTWLTTPESLTKCSGCECGNPFTLCHPDA